MYLNADETAETEKDDQRDDPVISTNDAFRHLSELKP